MVAVVGTAEVVVLGSMRFVVVAAAVEVGMQEAAGKQAGGEQDTAVGESVAPGQQGIAAVALAVHRRDRAGVVGHQDTIEQGWRPVQ